MPTILLVSYSGVFGGSEQVLLDCAAAAPGTPVLACPEGPLAARARAAGLTVLALPSRPLDLRAGAVARGRAVGALAAHGRDLRRLHRELAPALTIAWGMRSVLAARALPRGARCVVSHQDFLPGPQIARGIRAAAARALAVCVPSAAVAADLDPAGALGDRMHVVAPGVDLARFAGIEAASPSGPLRVLVLGVLAEWKRPDLALEAVALARRELPGLQLRFAGAPVTGSADPSAALRVRAAQPDLAGAVTFAGAVEDPAGELAAAHCLLHCAPREPFGIALLEAGASGRPVVAPDAAGPREIVQDTSGVLYAAGDARAAARALVDVLGDPERAAQLGAGGRARVTANFDRRRTRAGFAEVLGPLVSVRAAEAIGATAAPDRTPELAIVTVTHNSAGELEALLDSVGRHLPGAEVVCVDSGSADASVAVARRRAGVVSIALEENVGFGRASNRGIERVTAPVTVFVNPDVVLLDDSLRALAAEAARTDRLLAPALIGGDGRRQDSVHPAPGSAAALAFAVVPPALLPGCAAVALAPWRARRPRRVGWALGAAVGGRTETLRRLGPFHEAIFMYGEDLELGLRAADAGVPTWFWPEARVMHAGAHATAAAFGGEDLPRLAAARHAGIALARGETAARRDDTLQALTFASRAALKRLVGRDAGRERAQLQAVRALRPGR